jgi:hypothetical protein
MLQIVKKRSQSNVGFTSNRTNMTNRTNRTINK